MKITITADAYAITSKITVDEIKTLKKSNPDALKVKDADGNEKFAVSYAEGKPSITAFSVTFGGKSHDEAGYATITGMIPTGTANPKEFVADLVAPVKAFLEQVEGVAHDAAVAAKTARKELVESITVA